ncbi:hypothetical protein AN958_08126 [Leucoagaricus sp. SymC.cos]|nr:hypothetical protein AN958_08126 [Leucoagaricus sp. SymC.cos]
MFLPWHASASLAYIQRLYSRITSKAPRLLDLPAELLFRICIYLDYDSLVNARQTCQTLYGVTNTRYYWETLCHYLESKPGIQQPLLESDEEKSLEKLRSHALKTLRVHERWPTLSPQLFHARFVGTKRSWGETAVLPGGKWLFGLFEGGQAAIMDLDSDKPEHHILFTVPRFRVDHLPRFHLMTDDSQSKLSFHVVLFGSRIFENGTSHICIYQVTHQPGHSPEFLATHLTTCRNSALRGQRYWVDLSERYFVQTCDRFNVRERKYSGPILQLYCYSDGSGISKESLKRKLDKKGNARPFFLPNGHLGVATMSSVEIFRIHESTDTALPELISLHRIPANLEARFMSRPFIGSRGIYLVSLTSNKTLKRIHIKHDPATPPIAEDLGPLELNSGFFSMSHANFGPLSSAFYLDRNCIKIATYDLFSDSSPEYKCQQLSLADVGITGMMQTISGSDNSVGRIIIKFHNGGGMGFLLLDLV